jgi:TldD protein
VGICGDRHDDSGRRATGSATGSATVTRCEVGAEETSRARADSAVKGTWRTPVTRDPVDVPIEEKVALLLAANAAAMKVPKVRFATSGMQTLREEKTLATTDGTLITQTYVRVNPAFTVTALGDGDFQSYTEEMAPRSSGWSTSSR